MYKINIDLVTQGSSQVEFKEKIEIFQSKTAT